MTWQIGERMYILGIDPGLSRCGYAVIEAAPRGKGKAVAMGVVTTPPAMETPKRLALLRTDLQELLAEYRPAAVAVERIFFYKNRSTAVGVAQASGVILAEAIASGATAIEYSPSEIKAVIAGDGTADKKQMQYMVQTLLNLKETPKPADAADAAAVALCYLAYNPARKNVSTPLGLK